MTRTKTKMRTKTESKPIEDTPQRSFRGLEPAAMQRLLRELAVGQE
jgi:hypothetical protein